MSLIIATVMKGGRLQSGSLINRGWVKGDVGYSKGDLKFMCSICLTGVSIYVGMDR